MKESSPLIIFFAFVVPDKNIMYGVMAIITTTARKAFPKFRFISSFVNKSAPIEMHSVTIMKFFIPNEVSWNAIKAESNMIDEAPSKGKISARFRLIIGLYFPVFSGIEIIILDELPSFTPIISIIMLRNALVLTRNDITNAYKPNKAIGNKTENAMDGNRSFIEINCIMFMSKLSQNENW